MPFRTEARKCNHWATGGLRINLSRKFNGTYMHTKAALLCFAKRAMIKMKDLA